MKHFYTTLSILFLFFTSSFSQNGLERIIVEKYYISDENDATLNNVGGELPIGSTTYRIYVDMLPGYNFQSCYGSEIPDHELKIGTTTRFFNNEDRGAIFPTFNKNATRNNTVLLDSWISAGYACAGNLGVLKTQDNGIETVVNNDGILKNTNPGAGIPLTQQDGLILGSTNQLIVAGLSDGANGLNAILDNSNDAPIGAELKTSNGLWGVPGGSVGPDLDENIVLIGQFTTDGMFSFELNIQIGKTGVVEQYVAKNREGEERTIPSLTYPLVVSSLDYFGANNRTFNLSPNVIGESIVLSEDELENLKYNFEVFDGTGSLVLRGVVNSSNLFIPAWSLKPGVHYLRIYNSQSRKVATFFKI